MAKAFCTCPNPDNGYISLDSGIGKRGWTPFVHYACRKPAREYWEKFIEVCECLSKFCSPYETQCKDCFAEDHPGETYRSWAWARKQKAWWREEEWDRRQAEEEAESERNFQQIT